jgi:hypothetical protein
MKNSFGDFIVFHGSREEKYPAREWAIRELPEKLEVPGLE